MYKLTQGTIISGVRSEKYPGIVCNGIIISARCDLANCKVPNVYYLIAVPCEDWLVSNEGFLTVLSGRINDLESKIEAKLQAESLDWESMKTFTHEEFEKVVTKQCAHVKKRDLDDWIDTFKNYTLYRTQGLCKVTKRGILSTEKKAVCNYLMNVVSGQATHYAYIPQDAYLGNGCVDNGLIVDLQELDRVDARTIDVVCNFEMDSKSRMLSEAQIEMYDKRFFLHSGPGYAMPDCDIKSPWIEYLMQRFSNSFIRIGVDGPQKSDVNSLIKRVYEGGGK